MTFSRLSLLWKILIPTSLVMTMAFAITGWLVERSVVSTTYASVEQEAKASFQAYESLWKARADLLASVSEILSTMSDVRAAFSTRDQSTIRDTAGELWSKVSREDAFFLVSDGQGRVIANLGAPASFATNEDLPMVRTALSRFPKQASGVVQNSDQLFQVVITPVYVQSAGGPALLNVLVAGYKVDDGVAQRLKNSTGGSEYVLVSHGRVVTSTLAPEATAAIMPQLLKDVSASEMSDYLALPSPLLDISGAPAGQLFILRSFAGARQRLAGLRRQVFALWLLALLAALAVTYLVARKIMQPVAELDRAAAEISKQNFDYQINVGSQDELGRLAETFQIMCESIRQARRTHSP
jgi:HAMP domain-containing protein